MPYLAGGRFLMMATPLALVLIIAEGVAKGILSDQLTASTVAAAGLADVDLKACQAALLAEDPARY